MKIHMEKLLFRICYNQSSQKSSRLLLIQNHMDKIKIRKRWCYFDKIQ